MSLRKASESSRWPRSDASRCAAAWGAASNNAAPAIIPATTDLICAPLSKGKVQLRTNVETAIRPVVDIGETLLVSHHRHQRDVGRDVIFEAERDRIDLVGAPRIEAAGEPIGLKERIRHDRPALVQRRLDAERQFEAIVLGFQ